MKPFDKLLGQHSIGCRERSAIGLERVGERAVGIALGVEPPHDAIEPRPEVAHRLEALARFHIAVFRDVHGREAVRRRDLVNLRRGAVDEFRSQLDTRRESVRTLRENAPADAVSCLEHDHVVSVFREARRGRESRRSSSDDDDVRHGSGSTQRWFPHPAASTLRR
jgi:hypothetical protein